jgi:hypothetical protein
LRAVIASEAKHSEANPAVHSKFFLGSNHFYTQQKASVVAFFMLQKLVLTCKKLSISIWAIKEGRI